MQIYLYTFASFNDAVGSRDYIASNRWMNKFEIMWKEAVVA
jgi:hypothetical protein